MFRAVGICLMLLAIALVAVPILTDCQSRGQAIETLSGEKVPMKCHWTAMSEIGVAIPMYIVGAVMTTNRRRNTLSVLSVLGIVLGGLAIAFPTKLIGVCSPMMICSIVMKPSLICLGGAAIGLSGLSLSKSLPLKNISKIPMLLLSHTKQFSVKEYKWQ